MPVFNAGVLGKQDADSAGCASPRALLEELCACLAVAVMEGSERRQAHGSS